MIWNYKNHIKVPLKHIYILWESAEWEKDNLILLGLIYLHIYTI